MTGPEIDAKMKVNRRRNGAARQIERRWGEFGLVLSAKGLSDRSILATFRALGHKKATLERVRLLMDNARARRRADAPIGLMASREIEAFYAKNRYEDHRASG